MRINVYFKGGGLGDHVARLPAVRYLLNHAEELEHVTLICPAYFTEFAEHLLKPWGERVTVLSEEEATVKADHSLHSPTTDESVHSTIRTHLTDHAFRTIVDVQDVDVKEKNYLQIRPDEIDVSQFNLPKRYVVLTTGFTAPVREWLPNQVNEVVDWLLCQGITPVFLGKEQVARDLYGNFRKTIDYDKGINLINKTTLLEAACIMNWANVVVGVDNGLLHVAACTIAPIVAGYTSVHPDLRMPYRWGQLGADVYPIVPTTKCAFSQSSTVLVLNHDFRHCTCRNYACLKSLTPASWIKRIHSLLWIRD
jgi:ADP-heptose:LPS heptosyltransferase